MPGVTTAYQSGVHGSRPAASAGCILYACTTHALVYRSDGSAWSTWADLAGTLFALTVKDEGGALATTATSLDFVGAGVTASGTGAGKTITIPGGSGLADQGLATYLDFDGAAAPADPTGDHARIYAKSDGRIYSRDAAGVEYGPFDAAGGGAPALTFIQTKQNSVTGNTLTLDSAPIAGHSILLGINRLGTSTTSAVSSTNTTWTKLVNFVDAGSCCELRVGVVGGSPGSVITVTAGSSGYNSFRAIEIAESLTGTPGVTHTKASSPSTKVAETLSGVTAGHLVVAMLTCVNTGALSYVFPDAMSGAIPAAVGVVNGAVVCLWVTKAGGTSVAAGGLGTDVNELLMAEVS